MLSRRVKNGRPSSPKNKKDGLPCSPKDAKGGLPCSPEDAKGGLQCSPKDAKGGPASSQKDAGEQERIELTATEACEEEPLTGQELRDSLAEQLAGYQQFLDSLCE